MLTLGAEWGSWAQSPDSDRLQPGQQGANEPEEEEEEADACADAQEDSWRPADANRRQNYDSVLQLEGFSAPGRRDGVHQMVKNHDALNSTPWSNR